MFSIKWAGLDNLRDSLSRLADMEDTVIEPGKRKWLPQVRAALKSKPYPSKRPLQTYVRTGILADSWAVQGNSITNSSGHGEWVVGDEQFWAHLGRWWIARNVVEDETPGLGDVLIKGIEDQWH